MRVAIIGAGLSGLSCAVELERNNIRPVIFEKNDSVGDQYRHVSALINLIARPIATDPLEYLDRQLGISLQPLNPINKITHYSPDNRVTVTGRLGYLTLRGSGLNSVKNQLRQMIRSKIHFNSFVQPEDIEKDFDYVVVADGVKNVPERYGIWNEVMSSWLKGGVFAGDFESDGIQMWLDNNLTRGAYIYLAPFDRKKAVIVHVVQNIRHEELNGYWQRFLESRGILKRYDIMEAWETPYHVGLVSKSRVGNTYFVGNAGGMVEPFLGFGQFRTIVSGVMAARSIVRGDTAPKSSNTNGFFFFWYNNVESTKTFTRR